MKIVLFIPIKLNSRRLPGKTLLRLNGRPLCDFVFQTVKEIDSIDEKYVYCSNEKIMQYIPDGLTFLKRDEYLDGDDVKGLEIIKRFIEMVDSDIYILTHITSPFLKRESIDKALSSMIEGGYDSAFSAARLQGYCWYQNQPINYSPTDIKLTQNIEPVYLETGGFFMFRKEVFTKMGRRIGNNPLIYATDEFENIDIDTRNEFDFACIAEQLLKEIDCEKN